MKQLSIVLSMAFLAAATVLSGCSGAKEETPVLLRKAVDLGAKGDWQGAGKLAQKASKQEPEEADAFVILSLCLENAGDLDGAIDEASKAVKLSERHFMANYTKGRLLFQKGKFDSCIAPLKQARALRPDSVETVSLLAQAAMRQNLSDASGYFGALAKSDRFKNRPEPWNELGVYFAGRKDYRRALQFFGKAEALATESPQVALNLAIVNDIGLNRPGEASSYYKKYLRLTAKNPALESKRKAVLDRLHDLSGS